MVADLDLAHAIPGLGDDARALVADDGGRWVLGRPGDQVVVAMAHADGFHLHEHFALSGHLQVDLFDAERLVRLAKDGGLDFHRWESTRSTLVW